MELKPSVKLWAALQGYHAQYGKVPIAEQLNIPQGHADRIEAVVKAAEEMLEWVREL